MTGTWDKALARPAQYGHKNPADAMTPTGLHQFIFSKIRLYWANPICVLLLLLSSLL